VSLDVFLTAFSGGEEVAVDLDLLEAALAGNGVAGERTGVRTPDGGLAEVLVDTDGASFLIARLTPQLSRLLYEVARETGLVTLPADGTAAAFVVDDAHLAQLPDELREAASVVQSSASLHALLEQSLARREEIRGAR
jgi:hypothetical protein